MRAPHAALLAAAAVIGLSAARPAAAQYGAVDGEWRSYGGDNGSTKYSPLGPDRRGQLRRSAHRVALAVRGRRRRPRGVAGERGRPADLDPRAAGDAADDRRRAVPDHRALSGGGGRRRHRRNPVDARSASLPGRRPDARLPLARSGVLERRRRRARLLGHQRGVPARGRRPHRGTGPRLRRRRPGRPDGRRAAGRARRDEPPGPQPGGRRLAAGGHPRRGGHADDHLGLRHPQGGAARMDQGGRRAGPATCGGCSAPSRGRTTSAPTRGATNRGATRATSTSGRR